MKTWRFVAVTVVALLAGTGLGIYVSGVCAPCRNSGNLPSANQKALQEMIVPPQDSLSVSVRRTARNEVRLDAARSRAFVDLLVWLIFLRDGRDVTCDPQGLPRFQILYSHKEPASQQNPPVCWVMIDWTPEVRIYMKRNPSDEEAILLRSFLVNESSYRRIEALLAASLGGEDLKPSPTGEAGDP